MGFIHILVLLLSGTIAYATFTADRGCKTDSANLWLDMVIVVDTSKHMNNEKMKLVIKSITDTFAQDTRIGTNYDDPRSTRVGIVTYNQKASVVAELNEFNSTRSFNQTVETLSNFDTDESHLSLGLSKAEEVLTAGRSNGTRSNYPQLIIVYTANQQEPTYVDFLPVTQRLQSKNISTIFINMDVEFYDNPLIVSKSPGPLYHNYSTYTPEQLQVDAAMVNCFCQTGLTDDSYLIHAGTCLEVSTTKKSWNAASETCRKTKNGHLATDFEFIALDRIRNTLKNTNAPSDRYHIGLHRANGSWYWQQPKGQAPMEDKMDVVSAENWMAGFPKSEDTHTGVAVVFRRFGDRPLLENVDPNDDENYYICENLACDTDNYCS